MLLRRVNSGVTGNSERAFTSIMTRLISYIGSETHNILPRQVLWSANGLFRPIRVPRERSGDEVSGKLWINAAREGDLSDWSIYAEPGLEILIGCLDK